MLLPVHIYVFCLTLVVVLISNDVTTYIGECYSIVF